MHMDAVHMYEASLNFSGYTHAKFKLAAAAAEAAQRVHSAVVSCRFASYMRRSENGAHEISNYIIFDGIGDRPHTTGFLGYPYGDKYESTKCINTEMSCIREMRFEVEFHKAHYHVKYFERRPRAF